MSRLALDVYFPYVSVSPHLWCTTCQNQSSKWHTANAIHRTNSMEKEALSPHTHLYVCLYVLLRPTDRRNKRGTEGAHECRAQRQGDWEREARRASWPTTTQQQRVYVLSIKVCSTATRPCPRCTLNHSQLRRRRERWSSQLNILLLLSLSLALCIRHLPWSVLRQNEKKKSPPPSS